MTLHYALIQFFFWFSFGSIVNFSSVYLLANGATNTAYGLVSAIACALSILVQPLVAAYADRERSLSVKSLILMISILLLANTGILFFQFGKGWLRVSIVLAFAILCLQTLLPLVNALATESMNAGKKLNFSLARAAGSCGYAIMSFTLGKIIASYGPRFQPLVSVLVIAVFLTLAALFPFEKNRRTNPPVAESTGGNLPAKGGSSYFRNYRLFLLLLAGCSLLYTSHVYINNFIFQIVTHKGGTSEHMGIATGLAGLLEILPMLIFPLLMKKKSAGFWICFSGFFFTLKSLGTLLAPSIPALYAVQLIQPLGWGVMTVASVYYVNSIMMPQDRIKGQAYMTMTLSIGTILGTMTGGFLIDGIGVNGMLVIAVLAGTAGTLITILAIRLSAHLQSKE